MATPSENALLSEAAYAGPDGAAAAAPPGWTWVGQSTAAGGGTQGSANGYFGAAYMNNATGEIVIANRGSRLNREGLKQDWGGSDVDIARQSPQHVPAAFDDSEAFATEISQQFPDHPLNFTGHSLGGAEAQVQAARFDKGSNATTFGAPGAAFAVRADQAALAAPHVTNYYLPGDPVAMRGDHVGQSVRLTPGKAEMAKDIGAIALGAMIGGPLGVLVAAAGIAATHMMAFYKAALASLPSSPSSPSAGGGPLQVIDVMNKIICSGCPKPQPLKVTTNPNVFASKQLCATIMDCAPMVNILPFGPCAFTPAPPSPSGGPCIPKPVGTWQPGSAMTNIHSIRSLRQTDTLQCGQGGTISILFAGQTHTFVK